MEDFDRFWKVYPKRKAKGAALKAWNKLKPSKETIELMLAAIEIQKTTEQWTREKGQFIPYPATWLNQQRWEDDVEESEITEISEWDI